MHLVEPRPPSSTLFPYTTLFRSSWDILTDAFQQVMNSVARGTLRIETESVPLAEIEDAMCRGRSEEHTSELQSRPHLVCRLLLEKKKIAHPATRPIRVVLIILSA